MRTSLQCVMWVPVIWGAHARTSGRTHSASSPPPLDRPHNRVYTPPKYTHFQHLIRDYSSSELRYRQCTLDFPPEYVLRPGPWSDSSWVPDETTLTGEAERPPRTVENASIPDIRTHQPAAAANWRPPNGRFTIVYTQCTLCTPPVSAVSGFRNQASRRREAAGQSIPQLARFRAIQRLDSGSTRNERGWVWRAETGRSGENTVNTRPKTAHTAEEYVSVHCRYTPAHPVYTAETDFQRVYKMIDHGI